MIIKAKIHQYASNYRNNQKKNKGRQTVIEAFPISEKVVKKDKIESSDLNESDEPREIGTSG